MNATKHMLQSKTVWASILLLIVALVQSLGYQITEADTAEAQQLVYGLVTGGLALFALVGRVVATKRVTTSTASQPTKLVPALLLLICVVMLSGCASAQEDRGSWGDLRQQVPYVIGNNGGSSPGAVQDLDDQKAVSDSLDQQIAATEAALEEANEADVVDAELVQDLTAKLAALNQAKLAVGAGRSQVFFVGGSLSVTISGSGSSEAASPGDTTQTPTSTQTPTVEAGGLVP